MEVSPVSSRRGSASPSARSLEAAEKGYFPGASRQATPSQQRYRHQQRPTQDGARKQQLDDDYDYKPTALRWWFLAMLVVCLAVAVGLSEYAIHVLPSYENDDISVVANLTKQHVFGRNETVDSSAPHLTSSVAPPPPTPPSKSFLNPGQETVQKTSTAWVPGGQAPAKEGQSGNGTSTTVVMLTLEGSYLHPGGTTSTTYFPSSSSAGGSYLRPGATTRTTRFSTAAGSYLRPGQATSTPTPTTTPLATPTTIVTVVEQSDDVVPASTATIYSQLVDAAGRTSTLTMETTYSASTRTGRPSTVTIPPSMAWTTIETVLATTRADGAATTVTTTLATLASVLPSPALPSPAAAGGGDADANANTNAGADGGSSNGDLHPATVVVGVTTAEYLAGAFLPTALAVLAVLPLKLISVNAKLFQPFHALASSGGSTAEASIFLRFYGWPGIFAFPRAAFALGQPVVVVAELIVAAAAFLAPVAAEAVAIHAEDGCAGGCYGDLGVARVPVRVLEALMAAVALLLLLLLYLLGGGRWRTGVRQNPWAVAAMAGLALDPALRDVLRDVPRGLGRKVDDAEVARALGGKLFALRHQRDPRSGRERYGVVVVPGRRGGDRQALLGRAPEPREDDEDRSRAEGMAPRRRVMSFTLLTWWGRGLLLFVLSSIFVILAYYENTSLDSGFERFMDSQGFGVRFFFTALGVLLGFSMATFFRCVAILSPYLLLSREKLPAARSILVSPPTNPFSGLRAAFRQRNAYLGVLALSTVIAELFLPVTLAHVPFSLTETHATQVACAWTSIAILGLMILTIAASFLICWPHMPVDPRTVAGAMYYVCDSWMLDGLDGLASLRKAERDRAVESLGIRFGFGEIVGTSWKHRVGIEGFDAWERSGTD